MRSLMIRRLVFVRLRARCRGGQRIIHDRLFNARAVVLSIHINGEYEAQEHCNSQNKIKATESHAGSIPHSI